MLTCIAGLAGAVAIVFPVSQSFLRFTLLRPLHEMLTLGGALAGIGGLVLGQIGLSGGRPEGVWTASAVGSFLVAGAAAIALGYGSGREYFAWPAPVSALLGAGLAALLVEIFRARHALERRSPEGFWLVGFGVLFMLASTLESALYLLPALARDYVKDLSLQWHAIDTFFAGLNASLYGCGVLALSEKAKPLRHPFLFVIASLGVLFTFAHHHYVSPQPIVFKSLSVAASMLALVSFFHHFAAYRAQHADVQHLSPDHVLWRSIEAWTLMSIASGVLFAVPQLNLIAHGTNFIVVHAMSSMIGVGVFMILVCGLRLSPRPKAIHWARVRWGAHCVNIALTGLWLTLGADGLIEGVGRIDHDYYVYRGLRDHVLVGFPIFGVVLTFGIMMLCIELVRAQAVAARGHASDVQDTSGRPAPSLARDETRSGS